MEQAVPLRDNEDKFMGYLGTVTDITEQKQRAQLQAEKELVEKVQSAKSEIEKLKVMAEKAEREGDYGTVAEIRYGKVKQKESEIVALTEELSKTNEKRLLKEEVDAEDIAENVAKATGIPVAKMMQSDREKLLICLKNLDSTL